MASRVCSVISNCTGRCVFCCVTMAREAMRSPWQMSRTRSLTRSQARRLLSMARSNMARSRLHWPCCKSIRMAQMSLSFRGAFCPMSLPLFQGPCRSQGVGAVSMLVSFEKLEGNQLGLSWSSKNVDFSVRIATAVPRESNRLQPHGSPMAMTRRPRRRQVGKTK